MFRQIRAARLRVAARLFAPEPARLESLELELTPRFRLRLT